MRIALVAVILFAAGCPGGPNIPEPDECRSPNGVGLSSLELGVSSSAGSFQSWTDHQVVPIVWGPQGGAMIVTRIRATGYTGDCMLQRTRVLDAAMNPIYDFRTPLNVYTQDDGSKLTDDFYMIGGFYRQTVVTVETEVGGTTVQHKIWLDAVSQSPTLESVTPTSVEVGVGDSVEVSVELAQPVVQGTPIEADVWYDTLAGVTTEPILSGERTGSVIVEGLAPGQTTLSVGLHNQRVDLDVTVTE